jgi:hypothetical protein
VAGVGRTRGVRGSEDALDDSSLRTWIWPSDELKRIDDLLSYFFNKEERSG